MREFIYRPFFPCVLKRQKQFANDVLLGIGGNLGDCVRRFEAFFARVRSDSRFCILSTSPIYRNPAFGYAHQPDFYNATMQISTQCGMIEIFRMIFYWERCFGRGRKREFRNAPRTLDVDLIFFNDMRLKRPYLQIPHVAWQERESVLLPLELQRLI